MFTLSYLCCQLHCLLADRSVICVCIACLLQKGFKTVLFVIDSWICSTAQIYHERCSSFTQCRQFWVKVSSIVNLFINRQKNRLSIKPTPNQLFESGDHHIQALGTT